MPSKCQATHKHRSNTEKPKDIRKRDPDCHSNLVIAPLFTWLNEDAPLFFFHIIIIIAIIAIIAILVRKIEKRGTEKKEKTNRECNPEAIMASAPRSPLRPSTSGSSRPGSVSRALTAPDKMAINGHFASAGQNGTTDFEHGIQIIDEEKEFKCVLGLRSKPVRWREKFWC